MTTLSLVAAVVPRTGEILKNDLGVFEREEMIQNGILHFVFRSSQSSEIEFGS